MIQVSVNEKIDLIQLINQAQKGEEVIIVQDHQQLAKLVPIPQESKKRVLGRDSDKVKIKEGFFDPLPEEILADYNS